MPVPAHILARTGDIAETVITSGDPARTEQLAKILRDAKLVNSNRGFTIYTGRHGKQRMTVATHGIGGPSIAIVAEELRMLGAKTIVRFGTAGGLVPELNIGDFVIPRGAAYSKGSVLAYVEDDSLPAAPDSELTDQIVQASKKAGLKPHEGLVFSSDAFYTQGFASLQPWIKKGAIAVEMECATLFTLGLMRGFKAAALLVASNSLVNESESELAQAKKLAPFVDKGARVLFEALSFASRNPS